MQEQREALPDQDIVSLLPDYNGGYRVSKQTRARAAAVLGQVHQYRAESPGRCGGQWSASADDAPE